MPHLPAIDVLLVSDDPSLSGELLRALHEHELATDVAGEVVEANRLLARSDYKVLVLDLNLEGDTAFDVLRSIEAEKLRIANIVIVAHDGDGARLARLDRRAIKTVALKPVDAAPLATYIRALTRSR